MSDQKPKILIVEDDLYTRELYQETLTGAGFEVTVVNDGFEGYAKAQDGGYNLILLDAMLPKMDGLTLLKKLKDNPAKTPNGPVVMTTNLARDAVLNQALQSGAKACLIKTDMNPDQLVEKVKEFLN